MNIITAILRKDISSIVFKYLIIDKQTVKTNYLKIIKYICNVNMYFDIVNKKYSPYNIKRDQNMFHNQCYWDNDKNNWADK